MTGKLSWNRPEGAEQLSITVIRHGKVDMCWPRWCNAEEFDSACRRYEEADILPIHAEKKEIVTKKVYVSTQRRSLKAAAIRLKGRKRLSGRS